MIPVLHALLILLLGGALAEETRMCDHKSGMCNDDSPSWLQLRKQHPSNDSCPCFEKQTYACGGNCQCEPGKVCYQNGHIGCNTSRDPFDTQFYSPSCGGSCKCQEQPTTDLRALMPSCLQYQAEWCWATAVSETAAFYNKSYNVMEDGSGPRGTDCHCVECYIVGLVVSPNDTNRPCCPPSPPKARASCNEKKGTAGDMTWAIYYTVGQKFRSLGWWKVLSQEDLDTVIAYRQPVILMVQWCDGKTFHYLTLAGSDGEGTYYVHDPMNSKRINVSPPYYYQELSYDQITTYKQPGSEKVGFWMQIVFIADPKLERIPGQDPLDNCHAKLGKATE